MTPRIGVIDIETFPLLVHRWQIYDESPVGLNQITEEWSIASFAWKWVGEKKVHYEDTGGRGKAKVRDDKALVRSIVERLDEADIVIGQNHRKFDLKKIHARMVMHGISPYSPIRTVDTTIEARKYFGFTSKKLEWMSKHLTDTPKDSHKEFPGFDLWTACLADNPRAWKEMRRYNIRDVEATEAVYLRLRPWMATHPNAAVHVQDEEPRCPKCGTDDLQRRGYALTQQGSYPRWQCNKCGGWARGKTTTMHHTVRKNLLVGV
jgi:ribosomal protein L37AE/L43A/DNA polymerase elongation subunit (family B)